MIDQPISIFCAGGLKNAMDDKVNATWYLTELLLCYKYGEKLRFKHYLDLIRPYLDDTLENFFQRIYEDSTWTNPFTGKKGY